MYLFIHIPKTGGFSVIESIGIRHTLYSDNYKEQVYIAFGHETPDNIINNVGVKWYNQQFKFTIVRNIYARFVSSYYYTLQVRLEEGDIENKHPRVTDKQLLYKYNDIHNFIKKCDIETILSAFFFVPQSRYIKPEYHIDKFFNTRTLDIDFKDCFGIELKHINTSKHDKWQEILTKYDIEAINEIYKDDIELGLHLI